MKSPLDLRHDYCSSLYNIARAEREQIRGSIAVPVAAISFTVFSLGGVTEKLDLTRWSEPSALLIILLSIAAVVAMLLAALNVVRVEWRFIHEDPPDLESLVRAERQLRTGAAVAPPSEREADPVAQPLQDLLTGGYYIAYQAHALGNVDSARCRTWAVRFVLMALICLALAYLVLPVHLAAHPGAP